jgi:hypothetical protein
MHGSPGIHLDELTGHPASLVVPVLVTLWALVVLAVMAAFALAVLASQAGV